MLAVVKQKKYMVLMIMLLGALQVWLSHVRVGVAQQHEVLRSEFNLLHQDVQNLNLELASLSRPDTLRRLAREKMGMYAPKPMQVIQP
ncbi:MAG: cell division protein FtsL [Ghiorsea sp.]